MLAQKIWDTDYSYTAKRMRDAATIPIWINVGEGMVAEAMRNSSRTHTLKGSISCYDGGESHMSSCTSTSSCGVGC